MFTQKQAVAGKPNKKKAPDKRIPSADKGPDDVSRSGTAGPEANALLSSQKSKRRIIIYLVILGIVAGVLATYLLVLSLIVSSKSENYAQDCEDAKLRGDWSQLELIAREWAGWEPDNQEPWLYAATAAQEVGNEEMLMEYLGQLPEDAPFDSFLLLSDLQFQHDKIKAAEKSFLALVEREPESKEAHRRLNFFFAMTRQRNRLVSESRRAIRQGADIPESYLFLVGADWITFTNGYNVNVGWAKKYPEDNEVFEVASALHLISSGVDQSMEEQDEKLKEQLSKSGDLIRNLRIKYPQNREMLILELMYHVHRANARKVGELLNEMELDIDDDSRFWRVIGWFHSYREDWEQAEEAYRKCLELNPFDWQCRFEYSSVLRQLRKPEELKVMQESAAAGKEIMRRVLQADNTVDVPRSTLDLIIQYSRMCGEKEIAEKLSDRIYGR